MKARGMIAALMTGFLLMGGASLHGETQAGAGQPAMMMVGEVFQFIPGTWAEYELFDLGAEKTFTMRVSMLESEQVRRRLFSRRRTYHWMEIAITQPDEPRVTVKVLAQETPEGPGEQHEAVVQVEGFENPIRLSRRRLAKSDDEILSTGLTWVQTQLGKEEMTHLGRTFTAWTLQAEDAEGRTMSAVVSEDLPPFGLYQVETPEMRMVLTDWGTGATSAIEGRPLGLCRWILKQIGTAMAGGEQPELEE